MLLCMPLCFQFHRMLGELAHANDQLEGSMKGITSAGAEQMRAVEAKMVDLQETIETKLTTVRALPHNAHGPPAWHPGRQNKGLCIQAWARLG